MTYVCRHSGESRNPGVLRNVLDAGGQHHQAGFTLIELIIFIVVAGVLAVGLASVFSSSMRGAAEPGQLTQATQIAQERMELILGQRRAVGFAAFADPCPGSPLCTPVPPGFSFTPAPTIVTGWNGNPNYKVITVTVTGPTNATLTALTSNAY